ncbi:hypothetical protein [Ammoniphilus sp. YIM 78166]|uniref:hypothetical protein n=1 Tax=Ammoniphilus sp. YIM 78166 TaxID=1644106 RepID=UPI00106F55B0|nr:hypothetical protein [Ammoniphilus sp. YIM 78166]
MVKTQYILSQEMISLLQGKTLVLLQVFDSKHNKVISSAMSWVFATNENTVRFALDSKSYILGLLDDNPHVVLNVIGIESVFSISGMAKIKVRETEGLTLKLGLVDLDVEEVRDINFYGSKITQDPQFIKTYNEKLIEKLDREVENALLNL